MNLNYNHTIRAAYIAYITQAVINNFAPLLFFFFSDSYGVTIERIGMLVGVNFGAQLIMNFLGAYIADKAGYRLLVVSGHLFSAAGLIGLGVLPGLLPEARAYAGLLTAVFLYGIGGGIMEVVISPIVEACPTDPKKKSAVMSLLHSFYCWGLLAVVLISTLFFVVFGIENWRILACLWAVIPILNAVYFTRVPIMQLNQGGESMKIRGLASSNLFWLLMLLIMCAGASELSMVQWASFFAESGLGVSKTAGDLAGPGMFAVLMGLSRVFYSKFSEKINLQKFIIGSGCLCVAAYLTASFSPFPLLALVASALTGLSVGIMWPGTLSIAAEKCPQGGTAMFALLALAGNLGAGGGPMIVGMAAGAAGGNIRAGLSFGTIFPVLLVIGFAVLMIRFKRGGQI